MSASTKLSTAVKALCYLAESHPEPKSSSQISEHTGANASKIRQLLSLLSKSGIVDSTKGTSGGFVLSKAPAELDLQEIYCAIEDRKAFHLNVNETNGKSEGETARYNEFFHNLFSDVQVDIENKMRKILLKDIMKNVGVESTYKEINDSKTSK